MNTDNKPDPLAGYGNSRMDTAESQIATPLPAGTYCDLSDRHIGQSTCRLYDYQSGLKDGQFQQTGDIARVRNKSNRS